MEDFFLLMHSYIETGSIYGAALALVTHSIHVRYIGRE